MRRSTEPRCKRWLEDRRARAAERTPELERRLGTAHAQAAALEAEAAAAWTAVPVECQRAIEQIHAHHSDAVAEVRDGVCQGCQVAMISSGWQALRREGLLRFDNCGRLLGES